MRIFVSLRLNMVSIVFEVGVLKSPEDVPNSGNHERVANVSSLIEKTIRCLFIRQVFFVSVVLCEYML